MPEVSAPKLIGKIIEWNVQKGYGYLQASQGRLFLHRQDFVEWHKRPAVGDAISFVVGKDLKGRPCAVNACHLNDGGRITIGVMLVLLILLILPAAVLCRHFSDLRWAALYALVFSLISFNFYANDKQRAREKRWRIPEGSLQLTALLGGWPGAFLAQHKFRHKVSKPGFQMGFWLIVLAYQFAAYDSLQAWQWSKQLLFHLQKT